MTDSCGHFVRCLGDQVRTLASQEGHVLDAAEIAASSIEGGHFVFCFGTGHSSAAVAELGNRAGTILGFMALIEPSLATPSCLVGPHGHAQCTSIEQYEPLGEALISTHDIAASDSMILVSHSGINSLTIEVARLCSSRSVPVIGITSLRHNKKSLCRHSAGRPLVAYCDVVIDTNVALNDALPKDAASDLRIPISTVVACAAATMLKVATVNALMRRGIVPVIMPHPNTKPDPGHALDVFYSEHRRYAASRTMARMQASETQT